MRGFAQAALFLATLLVAAMLPAEKSTAITRSWNLTVGDSWHTPQNWFPDPPAVTNASDDVSISNGGIAKLTQPGGQANLVRLGAFGGNDGTLQVSGSGRLTTSFVEVGQEANGTLNVQSGGQISGGSSFIATLSESISTATVSGSSSSWTNTGDLHVGFGGTGTLNILSGGTVTNAIGQIATASGSLGTVIVDASTWTNSSGLNVGVSGTGSLEVKNGGRVTSSGGGVGNNFNSVGTVTVESGSSWTMPLDLSVGNSVGVRGTLNIITTGSQPTLVSNGQARLGTLLDSHGEVTVSGSAAAWRSSLDVFVGGAGTGIVNINGAANMHAGTLTVDTNGTVNLNDGALVVSPTGTALGDGIQVGTTGLGILNITRGGKVFSSTQNNSIDGLPSTRVNVDGSGSLLDVSGLLRVGLAADGALNITRGGRVQSGRAVIGNSFTLASDGNVTVDGVDSQGTASQWLVGNELVVGNAGDGSLSITGGGKVEVGTPGGTGSQFHIGKLPGGLLGSFATVDGNESSLNVYGDLTVGERGFGTLRIKNGADVENEKGLIGVFAGADGAGIVENGNWLLNRSLVVGDQGNALLDVHANGVVIVSEGGTIGPNGKLSGNGLLTTPLEILSHGTVAPSTFVQAGAGLGSGDHAAGAAPLPGMLNIQGRYTQGSTGKLEIELASPTSYDVLNVTGAAALDGTLEVKLLDGFVPSPSHTFNFLTAGSRSGQFKNVVVTSSDGGGSFTITPTPTGLALSNFQPAPGAGGLVAHWNAENGAVDVTGNGHDGIFRGDAATTTDGPFGKAFTLDGNGDYIEIGDELDMGASNFTLAAWVKGDPGMNQWACILDKGYASAYELGRTGFAHTVGFTYLNSDPSFTSSTSLIDNTWHHIAVVKSGTTATVYADGVAENTVTVSSGPQDNALPLLIGFNPGEGLAGAWMGLLDELRIYNRALGASEIAGLAIIPDDLSGDFNDDGTVDAADYVVWRKTIGTQSAYDAWQDSFGRATSTQFDGDFNADGNLNAADYVVWRKLNGGDPQAYNDWRENFGATLSGGGRSPTVEAGSNVPEPAAAAVLFLGLATFRECRRN